MQRFEPRQSSFCQPPPPPRIQPESLFPARMPGSGSTAPNSQRTVRVIIQK